MMYRATSVGPYQAELGGEQRDLVVTGRGGGVLRGARHDAVAQVEFESKI
jgi:hypothetical protein